MPFVFLRATLAQMVCASAEASVRRWSRAPWGRLHADTGDESWLRVRRHKQTRRITHIGCIACRAFFQEKHAVPTGLGSYVRCAVAICSAQSSHLERHSKSKWHKIAVQSMIGAPVPDGADFKGFRCSAPPLDENKRGLGLLFSWFAKSSHDWPPRIRGTRTH